MSQHLRFILLLLLSYTTIIRSSSTPDNDTPNKDPSKDLFCAVLNPQTGQYIDLSQLSSTPNEIMDPKKQSKESPKTRWLVKGWGDDMDKNFTISICSSPISDDKDSSKNKNNARNHLNNRTGAYYSQYITNEETKVESFKSIGDFGIKPQLHNANSRKLILKYENGSYCPDKKYRKSTLLNFVCDRETTTKATISYIGSLNECSYFFEVRSVYACPTSNKTNEINVVGIFIGIIIVFILVQYLRRSMHRRIMLKDDPTSRTSNINRDNSYFPNANATNGMTNPDRSFQRNSTATGFDQPNWDFFENRSFLSKVSEGLKTGIKNIVTPIGDLLGDYRRNPTARHSNTRPIRLYSSPFASNSQTSFLRDIEVQNNLLDSLEVTSENGSETATNNTNGNTSSIGQSDGSLS